MDAAKYRRLLREGDAPLDIDFGGVIGMTNTLKRIKLISDLEEQKKEAKRIWKIHDTYHPRRLTVDPPSEVKPSEPYGLLEYESLLSQLEKLSEGVKKPKPYNPVPPIPREEPKPKEESYQNEEYISCQECFKEIKVGTKYFYKKGTVEKFCSKKCFLDYHGEYCHKCNNKFLTVYHHWKKKEYPDIFYCSICYDLVKKEEQEEDERWERLTNHLCRYCQIETNSIFDVCDKEECLNKMNEEIERKYKINNDHDNNNPPRERERERERESKFRGRNY